MFETLSENLIKRGYEIRTFERKEDAADYLCASLQGVTVGIGGSVTVLELKVAERLAKNNEVYWHWLEGEGRTLSELRQMAVNTDVYLSSVNAISEQGDIVNIDGTCNRVASTLYGHKKVYFILGRNKITPDCDSAVYRARNVAAPKNAQRLKRNTPCAVKADRCYNCSSPDRICRSLNILWEKPTGANVEILLIDEDLGY